MIEPVKPNIYQAIRNAIETSDKTRYRIWQETGISQSQLCQFMAGSKGLSVETIEDLADCLDLEIIFQSKKRGKTRTTQSSRKGR